MLAYLFLILLGGLVRKAEAMEDEQVRHGSGRRLLLIREVGLRSSVACIPRGSKDVGLNERGSLNRTENRGVTSMVPGGGSVRDG